MARAKRSSAGSGSPSQFYPAAAKPCLGQVGIEHERAIDKGGAYLEIANNKR